MFSNEFEFLDFGQTKHSKIPEGCISLIYRPNPTASSNKNKAYTISFTSADSAYILKKGCTHFRIGVNRLTNEYFFVFSKEEPNSQLIRVNNCGKCKNIVISSKAVVALLAEALNVQKDADGNVREYIKISGNLAHNAQVATYKIINN